MNKYYHYLNIKHSWTGINCLTLIEDIYKQERGLDFKESFLRLEAKDYENLSRKWFLKNFTKDTLINESKYWYKIDLTNLELYDILVFVDKKDRPIHFGMYLSNYNFIHVEEDKYVTISLLNDEWREILEGAYRYVV